MDRLVRLYYGGCVIDESTSGSQFEGMTVRQLVFYISGSYTLNHILYLHDIWPYMQWETNYTKKNYLHSNLRLSLLSLTHGLRFLWTVRVVAAHPVPLAITISVMTYLKTTLIPTPTYWALHTRWRQLLRSIADIILLKHPRIKIK